MESSTIHYWEVPLSNGGAGIGAIEPGRITHSHDGGLVVFLIGTRINRPLAVRSWWPIATAMPRMLTELYQDKESGLMGHQMYFTPPRVMLVQYWRSTEQLLAYAHDRGSAHRPAWREYNRAVREGDGAVGIWHETYVVPAGAAEAIYANMPPTGLAAAAGSRPVGARNDSARQRLGIDG